NLVSESLGGLEANASRRQLQLLVSDVNEDGKMDLLVTDQSGALRVVSDFRQQVSGTFTIQENVLWQPLAEQYGSLNFGKGTALTAANLDGKPGQELLVGLHTGG